MIIISLVRNLLLSVDQPFSTKRMVQFVANLAKVGGDGTKFHLKLSVVNVENDCETPKFDDCPNDIVPILKFVLEKDAYVSTRWWVVKVPSPSLSSLVALLWYLFRRKRSLRSTKCSTLSFNKSP